MRTKDSYENNLLHGEPRINIELKESRIRNVYDILAHINTGMWTIEREEGKPPRMFADPIMRKLIGATEDATPEECFAAWSSGISEIGLQQITAMDEAIATKGVGEANYPWRYSDGRTIFVRCYGTLDNEDVSFFRASGFHQDLTQAYLDKRDWNNYVRAISRSYLSSFRFDLVNDKQMTITNTVFNGDYADDDNCMSLQERLNLWGAEELGQSFQKNSSDFLNLGHLRNRLEKVNLVSREFNTITTGWINLEVVALARDDIGKVTELLLLIRHIDVQKRRELEMNEALHAALEDAQRANAAKTDFLSAMSHDIRTPMNAITGMVDIALRYEKDTERVQDSLIKIKNTAKQLCSLINDILDVSAIESGKLELRPSTNNLLSSIDTCKSLFLSQAISRSQKLNFNVHDFISPWVSCDDVRINQILTNLLGNAIKFTPEGGSISLEAYQEYDKDGTLYTVGIVSDTGIGMSPEFIKHMWNTFSRATDTRIDKVQGSGLGLSIVKKLVELMQGTIEVDSIIDKGTTFTVRLPLTPATHLAQTEAIQVSDNSILNLHLLLAEDNDMNWEIASELLSIHGITTERAVDGEICLQKFTSAPEGTYDGIFMDMQMPIMNGLESTAAIRASKHPQAKTIPIIAMTANAFSEDISKCLESGMNDHLSKPIEIDKVIATLKRYMNK